MEKEWKTITPIKPEPDFQEAFGRLEYYIRTAKRMTGERLEKEGKSDQEITIGLQREYRAYIHLADFVDELRDEFNLNMEDEPNE